MVALITTQYLLIIIAFLVSMGIAWTTIPAVIKVAEQKNLMDKPDGVRKKHRFAIPTLGGIAIFSAFLISFSLFGATPGFQLFPYIIAGGAVLFFAGLKDDILVLSPVKKMLSQIIAATIVVVLGGAVIPGLDGFLGINNLPQWISIPFSIFALVIILNAYNLIDGVDGLAGSIGLLASMIFGFWFVFHHAYGEAILAFTLAGALLGFLFYNLNPAKIFMGDTGSMTIGFLLAVMAFQVMNVNAQLPADQAMASPAIFAFSILIIPMFDTVRVIILRLKRGQSPMEADNNHIHHRLMRLGMRHNGVVSILLSANIVVIVTALLTDGLNATAQMALVMILPLGILPICTTRYLWTLRNSNAPELPIKDHIDASPTTPTEESEKTEQEVARV